MIEYTRSTGGVYRVNDNGYITNLGDNEKKLFTDNLKISTELFPDRDRNNNPKWIENVLGRIEDKIGNGVSLSEHFMENDLAGILDANRSNLQKLSLINLSDCVLLVTKTSVYLADYEQSGKPVNLMKEVNRVLENNGRNIIVYAEMDHSTGVEPIREEEEYSDSE